MTVRVFDAVDERKHLIRAVMSLLENMDGKKSSTLAATYQEMDPPRAYEEAVLGEAHCLYQGYTCDS